MVTDPPADTDGSADALRRALLAIKDLRGRLDRAERAAHEPIAIVGAGCRFPGGANSPREYWRLLAEGRDAVGPVPSARWDHAAFYDPDPERPGKIYTDRAAFVDGPVDRFDSRFFGIAPVEANSMDPQQRFLLEVGWEALEDAGIAPTSLVGSETGVFVGLSTSDYANLQLTVPDELAETHSGTGVSPAVAAGRISYVLGLRGPSMTIDTACSSSLVAIAQAVGSLRSGACDLALAGGVNLMLEPRAMVLLSRFRALSPTGRCHTFGAAADGYVRGEGCGIVVLKRLSDAEAAGDRILALIRGVAVNHDGRSSGLTVPSPAAQRQVIDRALADAQLEAADIDIVEAHGTGTELGDPIEVRALAQVHRGRDPSRPLLLTAAKTNIGHLEAAAGVAGVLKVVLAMGHETIPAHLHCEELSGHVDWEAIPVTVQRQARPWHRSERPRRAGVSAFGFSGTNAHLIIEEPPAPPARSARQELTRPYLIPWSADAEAPLVELGSRIAAALEAGTDPRDLAVTMQTGRSRFARRAAIVGTDVETTIRALKAFGADGRDPGVVAGRSDGRPRVAMIFTGQGAQHAHMAHRLFESEPVFRDAVERCDAAMRPHLEHPLTDVLYGDGRLAELVDRTQFTQPAMFAVQCGLVALWRARGVEPVAVLGHSIGEYAAAVTAGVMELEAAAELIAVRGSLMGSLPDGGSMLAVFADPSQIDSLVDRRADAVAIAALNGPSNTVLSGDRSALQEIADELVASDIRHRWLDVSHAFHSPLMRPVIEAFTATVGRTTLATPTVPFASALTGAVETAAFADPDYWVRHVLEPVRFADALASIGSLDVSHYVEIGPTPTLLGMAARNGVGTDRLLPSLRRDRDEATQMLESLAALWVAGLEPNWSAVSDAEARRTSAPTYPFQRQRHWLRNAADPAPRTDAAIDPVDRLVYRLSWEPVRLAADAQRPRAAGPWSVIGDGGTVVADALRDRGLEVIEAGWTDCAEVGVPPGGFAGVVLVADQALGPDGTGSDRVALERMRHGVETVRARSWLAEGAHLHVVVRNGEAVDAASPVATGAATVIGMAIAVGTEVPALGVRTIDVGTPPLAGARWTELVATALVDAAGETRVAIRDDQLLGARLVRSVLPAGEPLVSDEGAYVITGGLGALGLHAGRALAHLGARHIVLVSRSAPSDAAMSTILDLRAAGIDVHAIAADVGDPRQVDDMLDTVRSTIGPLHGVIHAAGALADATLEHLDAEHFDATLRPKYDGAWNLHRATAGDPLRCFVLYSSAAAVIGSIGQANYAAANAGIDALAHLRRREGRPALTIDWGGWAEIGMASRLPAAHVARLRAAGSNLLDPTLTASILERALRSDETQLVVVDIDWQRAATASNRPLPLISHLVGAAAADAAAVDAPAAPPLVERDLSGDELAGAVRDIVRAEIASVLGLDHIDRLDDTDDVTSLGIDSLMAVEVANRLGSRLRLDVPPTSALEHPVVGQLAGHLAQLVADRRDAGGRRPSVTLPVPEVLVERGVPVVGSSPQQRMLFLDQFSPGMTVFNLPVVLRFRGGLDVDALRGAVSELVRRHESLRTGFELIDGVWHQRVMDPEAAGLPWSVEGVADEGAALEVARSEVARPFDLQRDVKVRALLLEVDGGDRVLVVTLHHIAVDGWSVRILLEELFEVYRARVESRAPVLAELAVQYLDYVVWRRSDELLGAEERALAYWTDHLAGSLPVLDLPGDRVRPAVNSFRAGSVRIEFAPDLVAAMHDAARAEGVTPFMFWLASYVATLARWSGQDDFVVGTAAANRSRPEFDPVVGMFVNTLPLRLGVDADAAFADLLAAAKGVALGAFAHQEALFDRIVEAVNPPRDVSRATMFQTMFVLNNVMGLQEAEIPGVEVEALPLPLTAVEHDVSVTVLERPDGAVVGVDFSADVFDVATIERFVDHWQRLAWAAALDRSTSVAELPLLSDVERSLLTGSWAAGPVIELEPGLRLDELVAARAGERPDVVAVSAGEEELTYAELMAAAHRIAGALTAAGVGAGDRVGVGVERSARMVAVLLAVLECGAAYVPLDPSFPAERLEFMIGDAGLDVVVTSDGSLREIDLSGVTEIDVVAEWSRIAAFEATAPRVDPADQGDHGLAYVIYTSGSTGRPKGVEIDHRSVVSFVRSMIDEPGCGADDVMLAVTTLSFDISILELFVPLAAGGRVVIASRDDAFDGRRLVSLIESSGVTLMQATPATWTMLFESGWTGASDLTVLCGGEAMPVDLGSRLLSTCGTVWNMFGPTETTIWSTVHRVTPASLEHVNVPIGRPIANTFCRVVDRAGELCPVGVPGELLIGGAGVARGYLGRPELTAERFVDDPVTGEERVYRTGDLARWLPDGDIEFLGRMDLQVKIRGFRVELGEIETALRDLPGVADAVVIADGPTGQARLVAYLVAADGHVPDIGELRTALQARLPGYMVPSQFVELDAFPLTPNRKVDRNALPAVASIEVEREYVAPSNDVERVVADVIADALGVDSPGVHDDFFELGGHSLNATRVLAELESTFGIAIPMRTFFTQPTIAAIADTLTADPERAGKILRIAELKVRLASMSAEEVERMLAARRGGGEPA